MENIHDNQLTTLLTAASDAFGRPDVLALVERTLDRLLDWPGHRRENQDRADFSRESPSVSEERRVAGFGETEPVYVYGLPDGAVWEQLPVELKLAKDAIASAKSSPHGVVLRSVSGGYFYATYDPTAKLMKVPSGFGTMRKPYQTHIPLNGAYRWLLVGVVKGPNT